jgi:hypothetical protein
VSYPGKSSTGSGKLRATEADSGESGPSKRDYIVACVNLRWVMGMLGEDKEVQSSMLKAQRKE